MVSTNAEDTVYGMTLSSVVPATVTGEDKSHHLINNMDLVMKLHYLRGLYFFSKSAVQSLTISDFKDPMFEWLDIYYPTSGRVRKSDSGQPFVKCNDSGVRILEGQCDKTIDELLQMNDSSLLNRLVPTQILGPELSFSPLVFMQFTWFKCGGISVGLSWAHILGDVFSASNFINIWGQIMAGNSPPKQLNLRESQTKTSKFKNPPSLAAEPLAVKRVEPVGDNWITAPSSKMGTFTFQITVTQLNHLQSKISGQSSTDQIPPFETLSSVIWQCLARIREEDKQGSEPKVVTICRKNPVGTKNVILSNNQILSVVKADFSVVEAEPLQLAALIIEQSTDETTQIEEAMEKEQGMKDFIVYGGNLTFVDLEEVDLYGLKVNGHKPVFANYSIDGVGDEGVVLVLPGPENGRKDGDGGRTVTVILPENQVSKLKIELKNNGVLLH